MKNYLSKILALRLKMLSTNEKKNSNVVDSLYAEIKLEEE